MEIDTFGKAMPQAQKVDLIQSFAFTGLQGEVKLDGPEVTFVITVDQIRGLSYFGRRIGESRRDLVAKFSLKTRKYIGITSMEAELSLVMSNLALVKPGQLVLDPFVGTGSFLYTTSAFGAYSIGSDIDGRQLRGDGEGSFCDNLEQYGIEKLVLGGLVTDLKHHSWRPGIQFDAIVTDPPYGVRAGAKCIGGFDSSRPNKIPKDRLVRMTRYPKTVPYEMSDLISDIYDFGATFLKPRGRLLFWYPVEDQDREG